jgi:hypothetical protein
MEYNTSRNYLQMAEYGRHIQKMIEQTRKIEDTDLRQQNAQSIIEVMGLLNPHLKNVEDFRHMLWDHLFFISEFDLDIVSPYPIPTKATYKQKPDPLPYPKRKPKYNHLGKNLELIIDRAIREEDPEKKLAFSNCVAYYMKLSYSNWHKELVHDETIRAELTAITSGQLNFTNTPYVKHRNENQRDNNNNNRNNNGNKRNNNNNQKNFKNNRGNQQSNNNGGNNRGNQQSNNRGNQPQSNNRGNQQQSNNNGGSGNNRYQKKRY